MAMATGCYLRKPAKDTLLGTSNLAGAATVRTFLPPGTAVRARTTAGTTCLRPCELDLFVASENRFLKTYSKARLKVSAPLSTSRLCAGNPAKKRFKYIPEAAEIEVAETACFNIHPAIAVIPSPFFRVGKYLVGFIDLLELLLCCGFLVMVRMILKSQLAEGLLYVLVGSIPWNAKDFVVIFYRCHRLFPETRSIAQQQGIGQLFVAANKL
jgi:hypothetical protein